MTPEIEKFVREWMDGHEPETFIKDKTGRVMYSSGATSLNLTVYFEELLKDYTAGQSQPKQDEAVEQFYPMTHKPKPSSDDERLSETVLVYDEDLEYCDLAYFDFESDEWAILGDFSFKMKCWCNPPRPDKEKVSQFASAEHRGYC